MITDKNKEFLARFGSKEHLDALIHDRGDYEIKSRISQNPSVTKEHLDIISKHTSFWVRNAAALSPYATKEHLDYLSRDKMPGVRQRVIDNPNVTKEQLMHLVNDHNELIARNATRRIKELKE